MPEQLPDVSARQLQAYEVLQRIKMARITLWFVLVLFAVVLVSFLVALFVLKSEGTAKTILGVVDGILGWALKTIIVYLFPTPKKSR